MAASNAAQLRSVEAIAAEWLLTLLDPGLVP
jgi:hypothetical protein